MADSVTPGSWSDLPSVLNYKSPSAIIGDYLYAGISSSKYTPKKRGVVRYVTWSFAEDAYTHSGSDVSMTFDYYRHLKSELPEGSPYLTESFNAPASLYYNGVYYDFLCWIYGDARTSDGVPVVKQESTSADRAYTVTDSYVCDSTLIAIYICRTVTLTYDVQGGTPEIEAVTATRRSSVTLASQPTKAGYVFTGWLIRGSVYAAGSSFALYSSNTAVAQWATPEVSFDAQGGYIPTEERTRSVPDGSALGTLPVPTRTDYTFLGWFTQPTGGEEVTASTIVPSAASVVYYAHWVKSTVNVVLDATRGSVLPPVVTVTVGAAYGSLPTPSRIQHDFNGWFTSAEGGTQVTGATTVANSETHTLYAHWTENDDPIDRGLLYDSGTDQLIYHDYMVPSGKCEM